MIIYSFVIKIFTMKNTYSWDDDRSLELRKNVKTSIPLWFGISLIQLIATYSWFKSAEHVLETPGWTAHKFSEALHHPIDMVQSILDPDAVQKEIEKYRTASENLDNLDLDDAGIDQINQVGELVEEIQNWWLAVVLKNIPELANILPDIPDIWEKLEEISRNVDALKALAEPEIQRIQNIKWNFDNKKWESVQAILGIALLYYLILHLLELVKRKNTDPLTVIARKKIYEAMKRNSWDSVYEKLSHEELESLLGEAIEDLSYSKLDTRAAIVRRLTEAIFSKLDN